jgi:hypothetical protein
MAQVVEVGHTLQTSGPQAAWGSNGTVRTERVAEVAGLERMWRAQEVEVYMEVAEVAEVRSAQDKLLMEVREARA